MNCIWSRFVLIINSSTEKNISIRPLTSNFWINSFVLASHSRTVSSSKTKATSWPFEKKVTAQTRSKCLSSVCNSELQLSSITRKRFFQVRNWFKYWFLITLCSELNTRAKMYNCSNASFIRDLLLRTKRFAL